MAALRDRAGVRVAVGSRVSRGVALNEAVPAVGLAVPAAAVEEGSREAEGVALGVEDWEGEALGVPEAARVALLAALRVARGVPV